MAVALYFCTPILLELFLCMHPQSLAIVSQLSVALYFCTPVLLI